MQVSLSVAWECIFVWVRLMWARSGNLRLAIDVLDSSQPRTCPKLQHVRPYDVIILLGGRAELILTFPENDNAGVRNRSSQKSHQLILSGFLLEKAATPHTSDSSILSE